MKHFETQLPRPDFSSFLILEMDFFLVILQHHLTFQALCPLAHWPFFLIFIFIHVYGCLNVCTCTACMQCPQRPGDDTGSPGTGVTDGCKSTYGCWEPDPDLLISNLVS